MKKHLLPAALLSASLLAACGGTTEEGPDTELCEHLKVGPVSTVTAGAGDIAAPAIGADHKRYDLNFGSVSGGQGGDAVFSSEKAADYVIALSADVSLVVKDVDGTTVVAEETAKSSGQCSEVKARYVFPMGVGTYTMTFGPTSASSVSLVIEESGTAHVH